MIDICFVLSHGFAARTVLHSGLAQKLNERFLTVGAITPNADEPYFQGLCASKGVSLFQAPRVTNPLLGAYGAARRYLFEDFKNNAALRAKHERELKSPHTHTTIRTQARVGGHLNGFMLRHESVRSHIARAETSLLGNGKVKRLLQRIRPGLVVSTYPVDWLESVVLLEAQRMGIPTVGQLLSWDNITCKGRFVVAPDFFVAWGPIMRDELNSHYNVDASRVYEAGVAHFDAHKSAGADSTRAAILKRIGLSPKKPYLFFGMSASYFAPKEIDVIAKLAEEVRANSFGSEMQLVIRPHPQNVRGTLADSDVLQRLEAIASDRVAANIPHVRSDRLHWDLDESDLYELAALIGGASVSLNSGSTLTIDSMIHDVPVVLPLFDADTQLPWWQSVARVAEFPHLAKLLSLECCTVTRSYEQFFAGIKRYLEDPTLHADARAQAIARECGRVDGNATVRIADAIHQISSRVEASHTL